MSEQEQQWEYCVLSTVNMYRPVSPHDASRTELRYQDEANSTVKVSSVDLRRAVIHRLGLGGWEMMSAYHQQVYGGPAGAAAGDSEVFCFKRPVKDGRSITEPKIEGLS
jgi:hypothetical protein